MLDSVLFIVNSSLLSAFVAGDLGLEHLRMSSIEGVVSPLDPPRSGPDLALT